MISGVTIIQGAIDSRHMHKVAAAYDEAVLNASNAEISIGSTTTRVLDFVNRGPVFDALYVYEPLLSICRSMLRDDFRLSSFHARTVRPNVPAQKQHADVEHDAHGPLLVSFIYMIDPFTNENGATAFGDAVSAKACGPAGSLLIFDGAIRHGHSANTTKLARRSLQGAFVRCPERPATDFAARMSAETLERLTPAALNVLGLTAPDRE